MVVKTRPQDSEVEKRRDLSYPFDGKTREIVEMLDSDIETFKIMEKSSFVSKAEAFAKE